MNHEPGTRINYYGDQNRGRDLTPMVMARVTRIRDQQKREVNTGAFTRTFGDITVKCIFHHNQTHIFIHVPEKISKKEKKIEKKKKENNYIRFYVHLDIITGQTFTNPDSDIINRSGVRSFVASAIWDEGNSKFIDIRTKESDYLFFYAYWSNPPTGYGAVFPEFCNGDGDDLIRYYESFIPSRYGVGDLNFPLSTMDISAHGGPCPLSLGYFYSGTYYSTIINEGLNHTPWRIADPWRASSADTIKLTPHPDGCCSDSYSERSYTFDDDGEVVDLHWEYGSTPTYRVSRMLDAAYKCHATAFFIDYDSGSGFGDVNSGAFKSAVYGDVFNGRKEDGPNFRVLPIPITLNTDTRLSTSTAFVDDGPTVQAYRTSSVGGFVPNPSQVIGFQFLHSWNIPGRFWWYGELLTFNLWQGSTNDVVSVINVNASLGNNLDVFSFSGVGYTPEGGDAVAVGTEQIKLLIEAAVGASGVGLVPPAILDSRLAANPIVYFGHSAVDIRTLPGTIAIDKPIVNIAIFAAPLSITQEDINVVEN